MTTLNLIINNRDNVLTICHFSDLAPVLLPKYTRTFASNIRKASLKHLSSLSLMSFFKIILFKTLIGLPNNIDLRVSTSSYLSLIKPKDLSLLINSLVFIYLSLGQLGLFMLCYKGRLYISNILFKAVAPEGWTNIVKTNRLTNNIKRIKRKLKPKGSLSFFWANNVLNKSLSL